MSSINFTETICCPLYIFTSEYDPDSFKKQGEKFYLKLKKDGHSVKFKTIPGHNHLSQVIHLNTGDNSVGPDLINFINNVSRN